jgi:hypothetical protein
LRVLLGLWLGLIMSLLSMGTDFVDSDPRIEADTEQGAVALLDKTITKQ